MVDRSFSGQMRVARTLELYIRTFRHPFTVSDILLSCYEPCKSVCSLLAGQKEKISG